MSAQAVNVVYDLGIGQDDLLSLRSHKCIEEMTCLCVQRRGRATHVTGKWKASLGRHGGVGAETGTDGFTAATIHQVNDMLQFWH